MLSEGQTDNRKTVIVFSSYDFSAPSESRESNMGISIVRSTNQNTVRLQLRFNLGLTRQIQEVKLNPV